MSLFKLSALFAVLSGLSPKKPTLPPSVSSRVSGRSSRVTAASNRRKETKRAATIARRRYRAKAKARACC